jgi:parallel beta-helix repeat protein
MWRAVVVGLVAVMSAPVWAQGDWTAIVRKASPSVVTVIAQTSDGEVLGTGFYISSDGKVATNYHVVADAQIIRVKHEDGKMYTVQRVITHDKQADLAILQTNNRRARPMTLGDSDKVQRGQEICVIGSALGALEGSVSTGVVSAVRTVGRLRMIQISAPISQGNSGSPVLNRRGEVIGVATAALKEGQNLNFAVPVNYLKRLRAGQSITPVPAAPTKKREPIARPKVNQVVSNVDELIRAIQKVKDGEGIVLKPGEYRLKSPISISKSLVLQGSGREKTIIVGESGKSVIFFNGRGVLSMYDLTLRCSSPEIADVVNVSQGELRVVRCRITGATGSSENKKGAGIRIRGAARAVITESAFTSNAVGLSVNEKGSAKVETTEFVANEEEGVYAQNEAEVEVRACKFREHERSGIVAEGQANLVAAWNTFEANQGRGIWLLGSAVGVVRNNTCRNNGYHGIEAGEQSKLTAEGNTCEGNQQNGIRLFGSAVGEVRNNTCRNNGYHGIAAEQQSKLTAMRNLCIDNRKCGIMLSEDALGVLRMNTCRNNSEHGIAAKDRSNLTAEGNTCMSNEYSGIVLLDNSVGVVRNNTCRKNKYHGIAAENQSKLTANGNICEDNSSSGIYLADDASGEIHGNTCRNNQYGISILRSATPILHNNRWENNRELDYRDWRTAKK